MQDSNDSETEDVGFAAAGRDVSTHGSIEYKRVAAVDNDGLAPEAALLKSRMGVFTILTDCAAVLLPLSLIVFTIIVWRLNGTENTAESRESWQNAIAIVSIGQFRFPESLSTALGHGNNTRIQLATVFPILFASVVGRLTYEAARWKLERGTTLGALEQLIGSRTVGATILNLIQLRSLNIVGAALVAIWALSPLGTQSILRMMSSQIVPEPTPANIIYFDTNARSQAVEWAHSMSFSHATSMTSFRPMSTLYNTFVSMPGGTKADAMDIWGNVKIPFLQRLDTADWIQLDQGPNATEYSSLAGIPLNNISVGNTLFSLESSYISLDCLDVATLTLYLSDDDSLKERVLSEDLLVLAEVGGVDTDFTRSAKLRNGTWHGYDYDRNRTDLAATWTLALDRFVDRIWLSSDGLSDERRKERYRPMLFRHEEDIEVEPPNLLLQGLFRPEKMNAGCSFKSRCRVTQEYVESRVNCSRAAATDKHNCTVVAQQKSQEQYAPRDISQLSFPAIFDFVSRELPLSVGGSPAFKSEISLYHLADPGLKQLRSEDYCIMEKVTAKDLGTRLSQLLNTYLLLSQLSFDIAEWNVENATAEAKITVAAETRVPTIKFQISAIWSTLFLVSSVVLFAAGISSVVFKHGTTGPEVLGYASTVLRDSRFFVVPREHRWLDGIELSRKMKTERLQFGSIQDPGGGERLIGVGHQQSTDRLAT